MKTLKRILMFTYLQRHLKKMIPLINELVKQNDKVQLTVILMTKEEEEIAKENNINYRMLDKFTDTKRNYDFDLGWGLKPLINAIDRIKPDLFLAIEVNYILRNAVRYCKRIGIPTLIVQHGTPNKYSLHAFTPFEGDCFAAWGQFTKDFLVSHRASGDKIVLTGGVSFDKTNELIPDKNKIAGDLNIDPAKKWIVFTTQGPGAGNRPSEEEILTGVTEVARQILQYDQYQLIYQVHPGQPVEYIKNFVDTVEGHNAVVAKYKNTEELMAASDGIITFFSTTAIDAVLMEKPLLLINLTDDKDFFPFVKMGAAFGAYEKEEIPTRLEELLTKAYQLKPFYREAQEYMNYKNDGKALERVISLCYRMLKL